MASNPLASLVCYSVLLAAGQALFKIAAQQIKGPPQSAIGYALHLFATPVFLAGCILYALSTILWVSLLSRFPLSQAYPLVIAFSILLTTALGVTCFREQITFDKVIGIVLIGAGVKFLSRALQ